MIDISKMQKDWDLRAKNPILNIVGKDIPEDTFWNSGLSVSDSMNKVLQLNKNAIIMDYGCGIGRISIPLSRYAKVFGVDISNEMLFQARKRNKLVDGSCKFYKIREGGKIPFEDGQFDLVYEILTIQHIPYSYLHDIFAEWARVLKTGGKICIRPGTDRDDVSEASKAIPEDNTWRSRSYTMKEFEILLGKSGFVYDKDVILGNRKQSIWIKKG